MARTKIRIFLSTTTEIVDERRALASLVSEINEVVAFLAPERDLFLELVHYETHSYPDMSGGPQGVIDRAIPVDYDIHFGVMWKRCGSPTKSADSGTVHEFDRALAHREKTGKPLIMFYFCMEEIAMPTTADEIEQLARVAKFRERLQTIGLTASYPTRSEFRERARIGLLRAVADLVREELPCRAVQDSSSGAINVPTRLRELCEQYEQVRSQLPSGPARTRHMTAILEEMKTQASFARASLGHLQAQSAAGARLAAIAILLVFPSRDELAWLADRLDPEKEKPFVGYQAAAALLQAVRSLPHADCAVLHDEVERARDLAKLNPGDPPRILMLDHALKELALKCR